MPLTTKIDNKLHELAEQYGFHEGGFCRYDSCESMHKREAIQESAETLLEVSDSEFSSFEDYIESTPQALDRYITGYARMMETPIQEDECPDPVVEMSVNLTPEQLGVLRLRSAQ